MWEAYGFTNEDFLWAGIPFMGGISGHQQAPCGAVSASAISLGLRHRCSLSDKEQAKLARNTARMYASKLLSDFQKEFGDITCYGLLGLDFSKEGEYQRFRDSGVWRQTCERYIQYIIIKLFEYESEGVAGSER